ncbi:hypothetical protein AWJ20_1362 [Sugiyamaella lignohabitans]|uniref:DNA replication regulator Sld3 C-terminal domain-containing protein n=1 Tax=Sugiyamaella lignohabitans TaxID=796027 RepID=A0A167DMT0_9ASCO|nr:uncharacterized protein AWJ20_1362 [Sugiyamaella lignohabitans]ANB13083.1 hypothetical protein AWJ20_1362 [Sugiyamaella lignohabitans]
MFPFSLLPRDSMWENSFRTDTKSNISSPFRQFTLPADGSLKFGEITFAKVYEENKTGTGTSNHLAVAQHIYADTWALCKLDKGTRMRDIRSINETRSMAVPPDVTPAYNSLSEQESLPHQEFNISDLLVNPTWTDYCQNHIDSIMSIDMSVPTVDTKQQFESLNENIRPESYLTEKYYEILYSTNIPVVYFAKSTLSKIRSICAMRTAEEGAGFTPRSESGAIINNGASSDIVKILANKIVQITELDEKYEQVGSSAELNNFVEDESIHFNRWMAKVKKDCSSNASLIQEQISQLKIREIQLQIIILLEILAHNGGQSVILNVPSESANTTAAVEPSPSPPPSNPTIAPRKSIVRKKKKPLQNKSNTAGIVVVASPSVPSAVVSTTTLNTVPQPSSSTSNSISPDILVDILFDRLCINEAISGQLIETQDKTHRKPDKVQEFCLEIILPFFASRLPDKTKQMLKKARGLSAKSSKKSRKEQQREVSPFTSSSVPPEPAPVRLARSMSFPDRSSPLIVADDPSRDQENILPVGAPVPVDAHKTHSRGGFLSTKNQQKRQVEMTFSLKKQQRESIVASELASAIKNISKPNRISVSEELAMSRPNISRKAIKTTRRHTYGPKATSRQAESVLEVAGYGVLATPAKKRTINLPEFQDPTAEAMIMATPLKRQRTFDDSITSSPLFITSTPASNRRLNFEAVSPNVILATPSKPKRPQMPSLIGFDDTNDDKMHVD